MEWFLEWKKREISIHLLKILKLAKTIQLAIISVFINFYLKRIFMPKMNLSFMFKVPPYKNFSFAISLLIELHIIKELYFRHYG